VPSSHLRLAQYVLVFDRKHPGGLDCIVDVAEAVVSYARRRTFAALVQSARTSMVERSPELYVVSHLPEVME
jgi:hypothetical protein